MNYPGGKNGSGIYQRIINQIPPHEIYIEPFLGSGAILRLKKLAACSIGIDSDEGLIKHWSFARPGIIVKCADAISFLGSYECKGNEFIYCDPPYLGSTRSSSLPIYKCEMMSEKKHLELLNILKSLSCMIAISGYWSELYDRELKDWRSISYQAMTRSGSLVTEWLWMNYPEPFELHDYSFLGKNFRERERIKRKKQRWQKRLASMPSLERYALLNAIGEASSVSL
jgi:DNA adenine methylase